MTRVNIFDETNLLTLLSEPGTNIVPGRGSSVEEDKRKENFPIGSININNTAHCCETTDEYLVFRVNY